MTCYAEKTIRELVSLVIEHNNDNYTDYKFEDTQVVRDNINNIIYELESLGYIVQVERYGRTELRCYVTDKALKDFSKQ